ncbi:hypothetical protein DSL72_000992 [Monilinia vaccinii-corymbosi]|uniref:C2H2-type domain-containing protein n=1 Tax=Monilinia vaccinii-corymbosi TaxID=61207 RepID=A0A8A3PAH1_9HELO|nr:hypothetical protein DSL72_000992 [Monilinia vaccinii-corymbosi]
MDTGETLDYKLLFAQRLAQKVKALKEALEVLEVPDISSEDDNIKPVLGFDSDNETSCATSSRKPPLSSSLSSTILRSVEPDKRQFFRPLADAITASSADRLGKILLRLCVEYPDARAVVESLLAATISTSPPVLIRKTSAPKAPQDSSPVDKVITTSLPRSGKQSGRLELAVAKSAKHVPQIQPEPTSARTPVAASEKRKWEDSPDTSVISQKKSRPYYVIPKQSKLDGSSSDQKDVIPPPPPTSSSQSLNTSEGSNPKTEKPSLECPLKPKSFKTSRESLFEYDDSDSNLSSGKYICKVTDCGKSFNSSSSVRRHMRGVHKSNGEPFGCSLCPKKFTIREYVYRHLSAIHTSNNSKCIACELTYRDRDILNAHMKSEHGVRHSEDSTITDLERAPN